jgi:hypothetical protein
VLGQIRGNVVLSVGLDCDRCASPPDLTVTSGGNIKQQGILSVGLDCDQCASPPDLTVTSGGNRIRRTCYVIRLPSGLDCDHWGLGY